MSKIKRVLLIASMVVCLVGLSSIEQKANTKNISANTIVNQIASTASTNSSSISNKKAEGGEEPLFVDGGLLGELCDSVEVIDIPPLFGFCGFTVVFGAGCGGDLDVDCVSGSSFCGGRITFHIECGSSQ